MFIFSVIAGTKFNCESSHKWSKKKRIQSKIVFNCVLKTTGTTTYVWQVKYIEDIPLLGWLVGADQELQYGEHGGDHAPNDRHWRVQLSSSIVHFFQCCGSGSESGSVGSVSFWASWIRIRILLSSSKKSKKNLGSCCIVTSFWLFFFENDKCNVKK